MTVPPQVMGSIGQRVRRERELQGWKPVELARRAGIHRQQVHQIENDKVKQSKALAQLAAAFDIRLEWLITGRGERELRQNGTTSSTHMEADAIPTSIRRPDVNIMTRDLPVRAITAVGEDTMFQLTELITGYKPRPTALAHIHDAFAFYVVGTSMVPRFKPREMVYVDPLRPPSPGDDVVVELAPGGGNPLRWCLRELVDQTAEKVTLRQHKPELEQTIPRGEVRNIWRIVPTTELFEP